MPNVVDFPLSLSLIPKEELDNLIFIARTLQSLGEECFLVGGSVRDLVLGKSPHEYDIATSAEPETVKSNFKRVFDTGILHGTVTVVLGKSSYEITTYRSEQGFTDGRRPDLVKFGVTLDEDLERRDFTINSLALDIVSLTLIDNHNGIKDIQNKIIRTIGNPIERFTEDGLRPIRGIRFASTLGFQIDHETLAAFLPTTTITKKVSVERFTQELQKILLSNSPEIGLQMLVDYDYFSLFTNFALTKNPNWYWIRLFPIASKQLLGLKWAFLKVICFPDQPMTSQKNIYRDFKLSSAIEREALLFCDSFHLLLNETLQIVSNFELKKFVLSPIKQFYQSQNLDHLDLIWQFFIDFFQISNINLSHSMQIIIDQSEPLVLSDLVVNGKWVNKKFPMAQGKKIGEILRIILEFIWENPNKNSEKEISVYLQSLDSLLK